MSGAAHDTLVVFDCDGVIVDSEPLLQRVLIELVTELGWPLTHAEIHREFLGRSNADTVATIERRIGRPVPSDFIARRRAMGRALFARELMAVPGAIAALDALEGAGFSSCIASSAVHDTLRVTLGRVGLYERFAGRIFSSEDVSHGKPAPDLFLHAAAVMGFEPGNCVVVEDSPAGIRAARSAGMRAIGFAARTPRELLSDAGAHVVIDDMGELAVAIDRAQMGRSGATDSQNGTPERPICARSVPGARGPRATDCGSAARATAGKPSGSRRSPAGPS